MACRSASSQKKVTGPEHSRRVWPAGTDRNRGEKTGVSHTAKTSGALDSLLPPHGWADPTPWETLRGQDARSSQQGYPQQVGTGDALCFC